MSLVTRPSEEEADIIRLFEFASGAPSVTGSEELTCRLGGFCFFLVIAYDWYDLSLASTTVPVFRLGHKEESLIEHLFKNLFNLLAALGTGVSLRENIIVTAESIRPTDNVKKKATNNVPTMGWLSDFSGNLSEMKIMYMVILRRRATP